MVIEQILEANRTDFVQGQSIQIQFQLNQFLTDTISEKATLAYFCGEYEFSVTKKPTFIKIAEVDATNVTVYQNPDSDLSDGLIFDLELTAKIPEYDKNYLLLMPLNLIVITREDLEITFYLYDSPLSVEMPEAYVSSGV